MTFHSLTFLFNISSYFDSSTVDSVSLFNTGTFGGSVRFLDDGEANTGTADVMLPVLLLRSLNDATLPYESSKELSKDRNNIVCYATN